MNLAPYIEHCCLQRDASRSDIRKACEAAISSNLQMVCVPPGFVRFARNVLDHSPVSIGTVAGFPLGYDHTAAKELSIRNSVRAGAQSVSISLNTAAVKSDRLSLVRDEAHQLVAVTRLMNVEHSFIFEPDLYDPPEFETLCTIMNDEGVDGIQLSTVLSGYDVLPESILRFRRLLDKEIKIKVSMASVDYITALNLIKAGADRIRTAQGSFTIQPTE